MEVPATTMPANYAACQVYKGSVRRYEKGRGLSQLLQLLSGETFDPQQMHQGYKRNRRNLPAPGLSPSRCLAVAVFTELFFGCGRLASAVTRVTGWTVLLWDITLRDN